MTKGEYPNQKPLTNNCDSDDQLLNTFSFCVLKEVLSDVCVAWKNSWDKCAKPLKPLATQN